MFPRNSVYFHFFGSTNVVPGIYVLNTTRGIIWSATVDIYIPGIPGTGMHYGCVDIYIAPLCITVQSPSVNIYITHHFVIVWDTHNGT